MISDSPDSVERRLRLWVLSQGQGKGGINVIIDFIDEIASSFDLTTGAGKAQFVETVFPLVTAIEITVERYKAVKAMAGHLGEDDHLGNPFESLLKTVNDFHEKMAHRDGV